ncbi:N-acyl homoserine lactonase family protein [Alkalicoccus halolimnae]|uniref:N-acyl homoserine lactonase family protein n=1 Tax=Alkalicoccus halolimnae TaxID=1667239 RepID=A0A5C7FJ75_9BACI|nr:N-acyl homoserine lactonase family protein [Alkalicoccus halolimnae]TXF85476.1 N-acyl homoserine lactonase family protein [Alkalicoccus halolimnae]
MGEKPIIFPLHVGTFKKMEMSNLMYQTEPGRKVRTPAISWLIKTTDQNILVDTGCPTEEWASYYHHPIERPDSQTLESQLQHHELRLEDIDTVINTHLHWDHVHGNDLFPEAVFYVQEEELKAAVVPLPTQRKYYEAGSPGVYPPWMSSFGQMRCIQGDYELTPDIHLIHLPGHTPGLQGVLVDTSNGRYLIAGDTIGVYENWSGNKEMPHVPQGIHWNLEDYFRTFKKMERLEAEVLPAHDFRVLEHASFGGDGS